MDVYVGDKHIYRTTDREFPVVLQWLQVQIKEQKLILRGCSEARCDNITKEPGNWEKLYDFSRTACSVLKFSLIKAAGLDRLHDPPFYYKERNSPRVSFPNRRAAGDINFEGHLANDKEEVKILVRRFGELYPYGVMKTEMECPPPKKYHPKCDFAKEMIVVCEVNGIVWHVKSCLRIESGDGQRITHGASFVSISRYELAEGITSLEDFNPFQPPDQQKKRATKEKDKVTFDDLVESVKKMDIDTK